MKIIGIILISIPFIAFTVFFTVFMIKESGWKVALVIWGLTALMVSTILLGSYLLTL